MTGMDTETIRLMIDLHIQNYRQGPGGDKAFKHMLELSGVDTETPLSIADIGCGTGSATIPLLQKTNAQVTAVDFLSAFIDKLQTNAEAAGVSERLTTVEADMGSLPFDDEQFDVIWSEGAIYNIGFETGVKKWKQFLKPGGILVASEITWLRSSVPDELKSHWEQEYKEVDTAGHKMMILENSGYSPTGYFTLTSDCWLEEYYNPLQEGLSDFLERNTSSEKVKEIIAAEKQEYELYKKYQDYYSYGVYIAKKI